ncbi:kinase-like protein [Byssothecium circinans]|uniref:Kinase-like protein n=1 Tax=Byssothecium circinans TaxID=147558 RepID=A0A6A5TPK6_9PLEO|nr:kinase-like protein [Byssothecium circinans]
MCPAAVDTAVCSTWKAQSDNYAHYDFDDAAELPYQFIAHLGNGRTAVIDKIKSNRTNRVYARKIWHLLPHNSRRREREKDAYRREIEIARRLSQHPHIVRVIESYTTRDTFALILEPAADGGDLKTYLALFSSVEDRNQKAAMEKTIFEAYGCLASGLAFMHSCRIRHRDIKPENILIHAGTVLYADFGVSRDYSGRAHSATEGHPGAFTMRYCAPEVKEQENRTWKSDVFSLGCVYLVIG